MVDDVVEEKPSSEPAKWAPGYMGRIGWTCANIFLHTYNTVTLVGLDRAMPKLSWSFTEIDIGPVKNGPV